jgi:hypothetical protein
MATQATTADTTAVAVRSPRVAKVATAALLVALD